MDLNSQLTRLYRSAEAASSEGLTDEAIKRCESALELLDLSPEDECDFTHSDFLMLAGHACWTDGDVEGAQRFYRQAHEMDPGRLDSIVAMGVALYHLGRFAAAKSYLEMASVEDPNLGEVWHYLGLISLREEKKELSELFLARANELEPDRWLRPQFLALDEIEGILEDILKTFPKEIRQATENVAILLEDRPSEILLHTAEPPIDPLVLGYFDGVPLPEQSVFDAPMDTNRILLFAENIALIAGDREKLVEELGVTLKHEIGHFLGLDEEDLAARGLD